jgi:guanyl-specific ribonuclease Sa
VRSQPAAERDRTESDSPHTTWTSPPTTSDPAGELADCLPTDWDPQSKWTKARGPVTGVYGNKSGALPTKPEGYYTESDVWPGTGPRDTERLVIGRNGEVWYTPDHYGTFRRVR